MPETSHLILFLIAALALLLIPGPAVLYVVARSISQGRKAGFISILGLAAGNLVHVAGAAIGLSALLITSAYAFTAVKFLGAAYLIFLGIRTLMERKEVNEKEDATARTMSSMFWQGIIVNILNPKSALFFFAFLPQFVTQSGSIPFQMVILGMLFIILGVLTDSIYALLAGTLGYRLRRNPGFIHKQRYLAGATYIALGVGTALTNAKIK